MGKFFSVNVNPDCINGDVSDNNGTADVGAGDIVFDWTAVDVPNGTSLLRSIIAVANGEDGAIAGSAIDLELLFAKSIDGVAPPSLGTINTVPAISGTNSWSNHLVGAFRLEGGTANGTLGKTPFRVVYTGPGQSADTNLGGPTVMDTEPNTGTTKGFGKLYVAAIHVTARNYGTGVLLNESNIDASAAPTNSITVNGVDARKIFSIGDQVYVMDLDTPIPGTLTAVTETTLTFSETNSTVDIDEDDELLNANPYKIKLGFEQ
tara:strand:- start:60 stop:848 length:789 start_codon:yes stop_codon:yes gene_type:complete